MPQYAFRQVDVFTAKPLKGNPLAVVLEADAISDATMAAFGNWTNLSETTFLLKPTHPDADYRVRIFTPTRELPFAGHPTLGSCHVWLSSGSKPKKNHVVQECGAGLIRIRHDGDRLAFAAPPLSRSGDVDEADLVKIAKGLGISRTAIKGAHWADNGPGWVAILLGSRAEVLALKPDYPSLTEFRIGVVGPWSAADGDEAQFEVRALIPQRSTEDPVTGSLNAGIAQWLIGAGIAPDRYIASQGTVLGRAGRVHVERAGDHIWVGGQIADCISGTVEL